MQEPGKEQNQSITVPVGMKLILFGAILLGILLLVIGDSRNVNWLIYAGKFILPVALFWGGFYLKEENTAVRITLLALGGVMVVSGLLGLSSIASLFGG